MTTRTRVRLLAGAMIAGIGAMALAAHFADAAEASRFSGADKKAIEAIVHTYLIEHPEVLSEAMQALQDKEDAANKAKAAAIIEKRRPTFSPTAIPSPPATRRRKSPSSSSSTTIAAIAARRFRGS